MFTAIEAFRRNDFAEAESAMQRLADGLARPLLVHVHIPKCAGTSFNNLLELSFGAGHIDGYLPGQSPVFSNDEFAERVVATPQAQSIASHSIRRYPRLIGERVPLYVCFLRDPLEWCLSNLTYLIKNYANFSESHRGALPSNCPQMSVRELAQWGLDAAERGNWKATYVVDFLGSATLEDRIIPHLKVPPSSHDYEAGLLTTTQHLLDSFFFVGVVEKMPEGLAILRRKLNAYGLCLAPGEMPVLNTSHERRGDLSWLTEADPLGRRILGCLERDRCLYAHARACFDRERHRDETERLEVLPDASGS